MANHQSAKKRIRQIEKKRMHNKYFSKSARNAVKSIRSASEKSVAAELYPKVVAMLDKLAKKNVIHKKKASNLKSKLALHINKLA
ncbi:MAG: 30S ribosomal protein S20 [Marinilabiliaceae bacterium]|nr:30S ribosomal protein S20 [Marinilabiliaceae bacterium]